MAGGEEEGQYVNLFHHGLRVWASSDLGVVITDSHELVVIATASIVVGSSGRKRGGGGGEG